MTRIIGIDLGTTNSCVAVVQNRAPILISNALGERLTKSVVRILENGEAVVGERAYQYRLLDPLNTITGIKRFIGRRFNEIVDIARTVPFKVVPGDNNLAMIECYGELYTPQIISAMILKSLKDSAEAYLGETVDKAVITIPAYFNDYQREATKEAGFMAGLEVKRLINEPTAAAFAYGSDARKDLTVAVFDLGGGTFDVSILEVGEGVTEVKAISGDGFLGGDDFDEFIVKWMLEETFIEHGVDLSNDPIVMQRLREAATTAKCDLSMLPQTSIEIPFVDTGEARIKNLRLELTRTKFEEICDELFERLLNPCERALRDAGFGSQPKLDKVILVGGATRMPKAQLLAQRAFGVEPSKSINPDEAVALGAGLQGGIMSGKRLDVLLLDVISTSLGIETYDGLNWKVIERNTTIPTRKAEIFSTAMDNQSSVEINVLEGDSARAFENRSLGRIVLDEIPPAPSGEPQIEVSFDIDGSSLLYVTAKDLGTGRENKLTVKVFTGLSEFELAKKIPEVRT
jgi:molecular chaperone DnaK